MDDREYTGKFGWTLCSYPTKALAEKAGMTVKQYANQVAKACYLNESDPVGEWKTAMKNMERIRKWLNRVLDKTDYLCVQSKNMDLIIVPGKNRRWMGCGGVNIPSFELFLSPDCRHTEGVYFANLPSYRQGNYVEEVRIVFKKGTAVEITAKKGEEYVQETARMDKGASRIGEFSLTDKRFSKINKFMAEILYDENFGGRYGNCHLALGSSYGETYNGDLKTFDKKKKAELGFNDSALHWDLINTEDKIVTALFNNGKEKVIYEKGMFTY
jgi:aminopeptidase